MTLMRKKTSGQGYYEKKTLYNAIGMLVTCIK